MTDAQFAAEVAKTQALADKAKTMKEALQLVTNPFDDTLAAIRAQADTT